MGQRPDYAARASSSVYPATPSQLCQNVNIFSTAGYSQDPLNSGTGNNRKVALADFPQFTYEINCVQNVIKTAVSQTTTVNGVTTGRATSFEACIEQCNAANNNAAYSCFGGYWSNTTSNDCFLATVAASAFNPLNPPDLQLPGTSQNNAKRSFRLLTSGGGSTYGALVKDAVIFQSNASPTGDLGLCGGPASTNYDNTFVAMQFQDGSWANGNLQQWEIGCGKTWRPTSAVALSTSTIATNNNVAVPASAEDCGRLCNYEQRLNQQVSSSANAACQSWEWVASTTTCNLYSSRTGNSGSAAFRTDSTITVGGLWLNGLTQSDNVNYKRDITPLDGQIAPGRYRRSIDDKFGEVVPDFVIPAVRI